MEFRELTILCGANSSGKSSVMQPLLLLKQTMDALPLDVGPLKFDGPNVYFSDAEQFLSVRPDIASPRKLELFLEVSGQISARLCFKSKPPGVVLDDVHYSVRGQEVRLKERQPLNADHLFLFDYGLLKPSEAMHGITKNLRTERYGSFLIGRGVLDIPVLPEPAHRLTDKLKKLIHIPGLRGNPVRNYARTVPGEGQPGLFHERVAGLIASWQDKKDPHLQRLNVALEEVGLTWKIESRMVDAASMELRVGRTMERSRGNTHDTVNIADVGFGVSQALPVLTALISAEPGQLVYCEQPEIHLHPRAQKGVADMLAEAARRGVQVIVETHSDIILSRIQWNIARAKNRLDPQRVIAHWFERDPKTGVTKVRSNTPDETGAFGDWPVDFADVAAEVDREYADAAYERLPPESEPT